MANACNFAGLAIWRVVPFRERCVVKFCPGMCEDYLSEAQKCTLNLGDGNACWRNLFNKQTRMQSLVRNPSPWLAQRYCFKPVGPMEISSLPSGPHQHIHTAVRKCCDLSAAETLQSNDACGLSCAPQIDYGLSHRPHPPEYILFDIDSHVESNTSSCSIYLSLAS